MIDLFYSDLHLHPSRLDVCEYVLDEIFKIGKEEGVIESGGAFFNGGDTFDVRGIIPSSCLDLLYAKRKEWRNHGLVNHIDNVGNHDQEDREGEVHPMKVFEELGHGWVVCDKPTLLLNKFWIFPYSTYLEKILKSIPVSTRKGIIAVAHTGIKGAYLNNQKKDDFSIGAEAFKGFKRVFTGHYHRHHTIDGVTYIGNPYQKDAAEKTQKKGVLIYDRKKDQFRFREIKGTPRYHECIVTFDDGKPCIEAPTKVGAKDYVTVKITGTSDQVRGFKHSDLGFDCAGIKLDRKTRDVTQSRLNVEHDANDIGSLIDDYVEYMEPDLDREKLLAIGRKFIAAV